MSEPAKPGTRIVSAAFVAGATKVEQLPAPALAEVAFAGRSNVGKSSLLNMLVQRKALVRTSNTPGRTRQINVFDVVLAGGLELHLVDLPGYGYAKVSRAISTEWGTLIDDYLLARATLRAAVVLVDVRRGIESEEKELLAFLKEPAAVPRNRPLEVIVVATKIDKLSPSKRKPAIEAIRKASGESVLGVSAETGEGREELWARIERAVAQ